MDEMISHLLRQRFYKDIRLIIEEYLEAMNGPITVICDTEEYYNNEPFDMIIKIYLLIPNIILPNATSVRTMYSVDKLYAPRAKVIYGVFPKINEIISPAKRKCFGSEQKNKLSYHHCPDCNRRCPFAWKFSKYTKKEQRNFLHIDILSISLQHDISQLYGDMKENPLLYIIYGLSAVTWSIALRGLLNS